MYQKIKDYVLEEFGLKISSLYISQVKRKCGIEVGETYKSAVNVFRLLLVVYFLAVVLINVIYILVKFIFTINERDANIFSIKTPLYNFFQKNKSYRTFSGIMSLHKTLRKKVTLYDKNIIQRKHTNW